MSETNDLLAQRRESDYIPYECTSALPPGRVLILAPHSDDEVLGCTAMISLCVLHHRHLDVLILTDGTKAVPHADPLSAKRYAERRQQESRAAARLLGTTEPEFLELGDRSLVHLIDLPKMLENEIARRDAKVILAPSLHEIHPDHRATALAAVQACRSSAATHLMFYEVGVPLWPNLLLDLTPYAEKKRRALRCFRSQLELQNYDRHIQGLNQFRCYTLPKEVEVAEAYRIVPKSAFHDWQELYGRSPFSEHAEQFSKGA